MSFKVIVFLQYSNNESCNHTLARGKEWWGDPHAGGWSDLAEKKENKKRVLSCEEQKEICCILSSVWIQGAREEEGLLSLVCCWC